MDDQHASSACGREHIRAWPDRGLETRHVVAERGAEAARLQKIPLHIDDDEGRPAGIDRNRRRLRFYRAHWHSSLRLSGRTLGASRHEVISSVIPDASGLAADSGIASDVPS